MTKAEIYTRPSCPYCDRAKAALKKRGIEYVEHIVGQDGVTKETIEAKIGTGVQVRTVPQIFLDGKYVGGCNELLNLLGNA